MIRHPFMLVISGALLLLAVGLGVERLVFIETAMEATGTVSSVSGTNGRCGSRRSKHDCTEFTATITFDHRGQKFSTTTGAGSQRGHGVSTSRASHRVGERLPVVFEPGNPGRAYHDTFFDLWCWPLMALGGQIATMFGAFVPPKRSRWS